MMPNGGLHGLGETVHSVPDVCDVHVVRGASASPDAPPRILLETPHGATADADFHALRQRLAGRYDDDLLAFFRVNTDVGSPELAEQMARRIVAAAPELCVALVRCRIPRTFVDCNRILGDSARPGEDPAHLSPGLPPYVTDAGDRALLTDLHRSYLEVVLAAAHAVCAHPSGRALQVHTYAPRSVDVRVDAAICANLRAAYAPDVVDRWPLRPEIDLIDRDAAGRVLADPDLADATASALSAAGFAVVRGDTYHLHPITVAHALAASHPARTLCFEVRRDLLVEEFVPFEALEVDPAAVDRVAAPLALAVMGSGFSR
jgi:hypothetical protein